MRNLRLKAAAVGVLAAAAVTMTGVTDAQAYSGDQIYVCGAGAGQTGYTGACSASGYGIDVLTSDGFKRLVAAGSWSPNNLRGFYVNGCFKARNMNTGYDYLAGYHAFSVGNAKLTLQVYYQGWC